VCPHSAEVRNWVPVDFEQQRLGDALADAGVEDDGQIFISWHGVVPYLTLILQPGVESRR